MSMREWNKWTKTEGGRGREKTGIKREVYVTVMRGVYVTVIRGVYVTVMRGVYVTVIRGVLSQRGMSRATG